MFFWWQIISLRGEEQCLRRTLFYEERFTKNRHLFTNNIFFAKSNFCDEHVLRITLFTKHQMCEEHFSRRTLFAKNMFANNTFYEEHFLRRARFSKKTFFEEPLFSKNSFSARAPVRPIVRPPARPPVRPSARPISRPSNIFKQRYGSKVLFLVVSLFFDRLRKSKEKAKD